MIVSALRRKCIKRAADDIEETIMVLKFKSSGQRLAQMGAYPTR